MKLLNKLLMICSFCFVFLITNVSAYTTSDYYSEIKYSDNNLQLQNQYKTEINLIREYIELNGMDNWNLSSGKYVLVFKLGTFDTQEKEVHLLDLSSNSTYFRNYYSNSDLSRRFEVNYRYRSKKYSINNGVVSISNQGSYGTTNTFVSYPEWNCNPTQENCLVYFKAIYFDSSYIDDSYSLTLIPYNANTVKEIPLKVNNIVHMPETTVNAKEFFDSLGGLSFSRRNRYENVSVVTYKILDNEVGNNKEVSIRFVFNDLDFVSDNIIIYKYGSVIYTSYGSFKCNTSDVITCDLNIKYDVSSVLDDYLIFDFVFDSSYTVDIYDTNSNNKLFINRENIEYEYKSINLKELAGLVLYPRNYDLFNLIYNVNYNDFNFLLTNIYTNTFVYDEKTFRRTTTYEQDFNYKNTYLYKNTNNYWQYYIESDYTNVNNINYIKLPFVYNSSLLSNNKFPCFVIKNPNYLGSGDTDNKDIFIYYNSSLFNFLTMKTVYNDASGTFEPIVSFNGEDTGFDFIYNGTQSFNNASQVYTVGHDYQRLSSNFVSSYNNLLEFFKDKIIIFFGLISNFFNTMPLLFQYTFSFIFILFVAIYLFRLLL